MKTLLLLLLAVMAISLGQGAVVSMADMGLSSEAVTTVRVAKLENPSASYSSYTTQRPTTLATTVTSTITAQYPEAITTSLLFSNDKSTWSEIATVQTARTATSTATFLAFVTTVVDVTGVAIPTNRLTASNSISSTLPSTSSTSRPKATRTGPVVGGVIGAILVLLILLLAGGFFLWRRRNQKQRDEQSEQRGRRRSPRIIPPKAGTIRGAKISGPLSNPTLVSSDNHRAGPLTPGSLAQSTANKSPDPSQDAAPARPERPASLTASIQESMNTVPLSVALQISRSTTNSPANEVNRPLSPEPPNSALRTQLIAHASLSKKNKPAHQIGDSDQRSNENIAEQVDQAVDPSPGGSNQTSPGPDLVLYKLRSPRSNRYAFEDEDESDEDVKEFQRMETLRMLDPGSFPAPKTPPFDFAARRHQREVEKLKAKKAAAGTLAHPPGPDFI